MMVISVEVEVGGKQYRREDSAELRYFELGTGRRGMSGRQIPDRYKTLIAKIDAAVIAKELGCEVEDEPLPGKIERHCPRCHTHAYHWLTANGKPSAIKNTKLHTATCANCGHAWPCRVMQRDL